MLSKIREIDPRFDQMWTKLTENITNNSTKIKSSTTVNLNRTRMVIK